MSWTFAYIDYSRHKLGDPHPVATRSYHATEVEAKSAARAFRTDHQDPDVYVISVFQTKRRRATVKQRQDTFGFPETDDPRRLTV